MGAADLFIHSLSHPFPQPWIMQPALRLVQKKHRARGCRYPTRMALGFGGLGRHSEGTRRPRKASGKEGGWEASRRGLVCVTARLGQRRGGQQRNESPEGTFEGVRKGVKMELGLKV